MISVALLPEGGGKDSFPDASQGRCVVFLFLLYRALLSPQTSSLYGASGALCHGFIHDF